MSKAQISQAFTYITIVLVVGAIAYVGFKGIGTIIGTSCEADDAAFSKDIMKFINDYSDMGSVHEEKIKAPCDVNRICFVRYEGVVSESNPLSSITDPVIRSSVQDGKHDIFVHTTDGFIKPIGLSDKVDVKDGFGCANATQGYFRLTFEGQGRSTLIVWD